LAKEKEEREVEEEFYNALSRTMSTRSSYSRLDTYRTCPRKYKYQYLEPISEVPTEALLLGSAVHSALEVWVDIGGEDVGDLLDAFSASVEAQRINGYISDEEEETARAMLYDYYDTINKLDKSMVIGVEEEFELYVAGARIIGYIDRVEYINDSKDTILVTDYKGLALDTRLPTPSGWSTIKEVQVGDKILGGDGFPCFVTDKSEVHYNKCYKITFDDNTSIVCDHEHKWVVNTSTGEKILTTDELKDNLFSNRKKPQKHLTIPTVSPKLGDKELPVDPYVLGAWFKHIPIGYLRASYQQRLDLLRGIMDTDGHWNPIRKRCVVTTTNKQYAKEINELVVSLGWKATTFYNKGTGFGKEIDVWQTWFTPVDEEVFLARLPITYRAKASTKSRRRLITSVEEIDTVPTQCLVVDSPDHTFLCGDQMLKTHNSGRSSITQSQAKNNLQMAIYTMAAKQKWPDAEHYITCLEYPRLHKSVKHEFTQEELDIHAETIRELNLSIKLDTRFKPIGKPVNCGYCGFNTICGYGKFQAKIWEGIKRKREAKANGR
jgi:CRISPR/Cas system-associated exonuclease Cas4 (RecB family)